MAGFLASVENAVEKILFFFAKILFEIKK